MAVPAPVDQLAPPTLEQPTSFVVTVTAAASSGGAPIAGASVRVFHEAANGTYPQVGFAETAENGDATLTVVAAGPLLVLADAKGFQRTSRRMTPGPPRPLEFELLAASNLQVSVVDDQHEPIESATVLVRDTDPLPFGGLTDKQGKQLFDRLGPAPYQVEVFARGYEAGLRADVSESIEIVLRPLGSILVRVISPDGNPVPSAEVSVVGSTLWPTRRTETNAEGVVKLNGLLAGLYDLKAQKGPLVSDVLSAVSIARGENKRVELKLRHGRYVLVKVMDAEQEPKYPVANASVVLTELGLSSFPVSMLTNKGGEVRIGPITQGPSYISARAEGFVARGAVPVPPSVDGPLEIPLLRGGTLRGLVVDLGGRPIAGARIEVVGVDRDGLPIAETPLLSAYREAHFQWSLQPLPLVPAGELGVTLGPIPFVQSLLQGSPTPPTDADWTVLPDNYEAWISGYDGEFKAFPVPPGKVRALVRHPSYVEAISERVAIGPGGSATVKVVMLQGAELVARVVDEGGRAVRGVRIQLTAQKGSFERSAVSQVDGTFRFSAVPRDVSLALARPDDLTRFVLRQTLHLEDATEKELEIVLPEARAAIRWQVVGEDERPLELAQVTFMSVDPDVPLRATRFSDANGYVEVEDVAGVALRVTVSAPGYVPFSEQVKQAPTERRLELRSGVWVQGKVTAVRGRIEVGGARVSVAGGDYHDSTFTDERGVFEFRQVPVGPLRVTAAHEDYARREVSVRVSATGHAERAFELDPIDLPESSSVRGVVVDSEGQLVAGARVGLAFLPSFVPRGQFLDDTVLSDRDGAFQLSGLAPGQHTIHAYANAIGRGRISVTVQAGDAQTDLRLPLTEPQAEAELDVNGGGVAVTLGEKDSAGGVRVVIAEVTPRSEAERAGLRRGDVIRRVDGTEPDGMRDTRARLNGKPGSDLVMDVARGRETLSFRVRREQLTQ